MAVLRKRSGGFSLISYHNEIAALVVLAIALLVFLSLISSKATDPSLNTVTSHVTKNWIGIVGAVISDILFQLFGLAAYLIPPILAIIAWRIFRAQIISFRFWRMIGGLLLMIAVAGVFKVFGLYGGIFGAALWQVTTGLLGQIGSAILLLVIAIASLLAFTSFTFAGATSVVGGATLTLSERFRQWLSNRRDARELVTETKIEHQNERGLAKVEVKKVEPTKKIVEIDLDEENPLELEAPEVVEPPEIRSPDFERVIDDDDEEFPIDGGIAIKPMSVTEDLSGKMPVGAASKTDEDDGEVFVAKQDYSNYHLPSLEFLVDDVARVVEDPEELRALANELVKKCKEFNVNGRVVSIAPGPVVTTFEFKPDAGVKYSRVTGLVDDLCLALKAESIRIDRIPGKAVVGIEVPNRERETIRLRRIVDSDAFRKSSSLLSIALGKRINGENYVADLTKMPHLLMAGQTGAGKSVGVNSLIVSILYKAQPDEVKFIMVDPKRLELGVYADIPHLATPIITDPKRAAISLKWAVHEMERRYKELAGWGVRNIDGFNSEVARKNQLGIFNDEGEPYKKLPYIVIIIDELADLMMVSGKEVEESITRLAQMARAVGIHLVLATQRPSVDVITGLIKANFPSRISFRVSSKVDSRTIIDSNGAEGLLGRGDMLFLPPASSQLARVHGAYVDEIEIAKIVEHIKAQGNPEYNVNITRSEEELQDPSELPGRRDALFDDALRTVIGNRKASTSLLQRHLRIGYGRAAAILDAMVSEGFIGEMDGSSRARPILQKGIDYLRDLDEMGEGS